MKGKLFGAAITAAAVVMVLHSIIPRTANAAEGDFWQRVYTPTTMNLNGVFGSATLAAAVGEGGVAFVYDGFDWNLVDTPTQLPLHAVWAAGREDIFAVGASGNIFRFSLDGGAERMLSKTSLQLYAVWGRDAHDVYAAGDNGTMLHFDGVEWTYELVPTVNRLRGIAVTRSGHVYVVGDAGYVFRREDGEWVMMETPTTRNLYAVWALADDDIYAVGDSGTVLHFDGLEWTLVGTPTVANLYGVWGTPGNRVFAVGTGGNMIEFDGLDWFLKRLDTWANLNAIINGFIVGDGGNAFQNAQLYPEANNLRITEVDAIDGMVEVTNTGPRFVTGAHPFIYAGRARSGIPQGTVFEAGGVRVFPVPGIASDASDLWLYRTYPFGNPENLIHGLQYGDGGPWAATHVAVEAGKWSGIDDAVRAPRRGTTLAYDGFGITPADWYINETPTMGRHNFTVPGTVPRTLVYPIGTQGFERVSLGDEVIAVEDWRIANSGGIRGAFTTHVVGEERYPGGPRVRAAMIRDQDPRDVTNRVFTPVIETLIDDLHYRWIFRVKVVEPTVSVNGPRLMVQHEAGLVFSDLEFVDMWGVEFRQHGVYLVVDNAGGEPAETPLFAYKWPRGIGDWVTISIEADFFTGEVRARVDTALRGVLPIDPVEGTDVHVYRLSYDGDGPGNTGTTLLDRVIIDARGAVPVFTAVNADATETGVKISWDVVESEPVEGFRVVRSREDGTGETVVSGDAPLGADSRHFDDAGLDPGQVYEYCVTAILPGGDEVRSEPATVAAIDNRALAFEQVSVWPVDGDVYISWKLYGTGDIDGFRVYRRRDGDAEHVVSGEALLPGDERQLTDRNLEPWHTYHYRVVAVAPGGEEIPSQSATVEMRTPAFELTHGRPNPFSSSTSFQYTMPRAAPVSISVYDVRGALVATIEDGIRAAGVHTVAWNGRDRSGARVSAGTYFVRLQAPDVVLTRKIVLVR